MQFVLIYEYDAVVCWTIWGWSANGAHRQKHT